MLEPAGFWSYARDDDAHSDGQLTQLRATIGKAVSLQYGTAIRIWQDIAAVPYGADWENAIQQTIGKTTFFLPVVTPRFLKSTHCRDEFVLFRSRMKELSKDNLIFPIHYVSTDGLLAAETTFGDELNVLRRYQWIDFRPLRFVDPGSQEVRRWAALLATSILGGLQASTLTDAPTVTPVRFPPADCDIPDPKLDKIEVSLRWKGFEESDPNQMAKNRPGSERIFLTTSRFEVTEENLAYKKSCIPLSSIRDVQRRRNNLYLFGFGFSMIFAIFGLLIRQVFLDLAIITFASNISIAISLIFIILYNVLFDVYITTTNKKIKLATFVRRGAADRLLEAFFSAKRYAEACQDRNRVL